MERCKCGVSVCRGAGEDCETLGALDCWFHEGIWVQLLVECYQAIDICVVEEENWVEACACWVLHEAVAKHYMDRSVDSFETAH